MQTFDALLLKLESDCAAGLRHRLPAPKRCMHCRRGGHSSERCIARTDAVEEAAVKVLRCVDCRSKGHANCGNFDTTARSAFCCKCGEKGHFGSECGARQKSTFNHNVNDLMRKVRYEESDSDSDRPRTGREKRYWEKIMNKAFKKAKRLKREHRSRSR